MGDTLDRFFDDMRYKVWNGFLNEMRHDVTEKQKTAVAAEKEKQLIGRCLFYLTDFARTAREKGVLAMEDAASALDDENETEALLFKAVQMVVDGMNGEDIAEVLSNEYWVSAPKGYQATAVYLCIRGMLFIQENTNPLVLKQLLVSMLPASVRKECVEICDQYEEKSRAERDAEKNRAAKLYFETDFSRTDVPMESAEWSWFEGQLAKMHDVEVQRFLREVENGYLMQALTGMKKEAREKLAKNMSARFRELILQDCYLNADMDDEAIKEGVAYVMEILKMLQACGEVRQY